MPQSAEFAKNMSMGNTPKNSNLGKEVGYIDKYDSSLLYPIARQDKREELQIKKELPFEGVDIWNAYELSWLNTTGLPQVAIATFKIDCTSTNIIESKSFKLYLNSFNQTRFKNIEEVQSSLQADLSNAAQTNVEVQVKLLEGFNFTYSPNISSRNIDNQELQIHSYSPPNPVLLSVSSEMVSECIHSHLLKSNCLVTSQPDWGSVYINYVGKKITDESLLRYIVSFRQHDEFHEQCVERIFCDILKQCQPEKLTVYARYTRRGGLDINPFRSNFEKPYSNFKLTRQ